MNLFQNVAFRSHAGLPLSWKVECDALTPDDWDALATIVAEHVAFGAVEGVPSGGLPFSAALWPYVSHGPLLIVDDVLTTGASMEEHRAGRDAIGFVAFSRGTPPAWVRPIWQFAPSPAEGSTR